MLRIGVVGLGYVGLTFSIAAADSGIDVYGVEINSYIKMCLNENRAHFFEPGLDDLIKKHNHLRFHCVEEFPQDKVFDAFMVTVGTPLKKGTKEPNFDYIRKAILSIQSVYDGSQVIILRSTVSVGTTRQIVLPFLEQLLKDNGAHFMEDCKKSVFVSMCPERTVEGKAVEELRSLPQIVSGNNAEALVLARNLFLKITTSVVDVSSLEEAELAKLYCNTYRDMGFAIGNAFCLMAQKFGVNGIEVIRHANEGYSRSKIAIPGFVAGPCLEKDAYILTDNVEDCLSKEFILTGRRVNESLEDAVVQWVKRHFGRPNENIVLALSGMAFKGRPETSDLRGSSSVNVAKKLRAMGYFLHLHDFVAHRKEMEALNLGPVFDTMEDACYGSVALIVLNNHSSYSEIRTISVEGKEKPYYILDIWQVCSNLKDSSSILRYNLGNILMERRESSACKDIL